MLLIYVFNIFLFNRLYVGVNPVDSKLLLLGAMKIKETPVVITSRYFITYYNIQLFILAVLTV
jgi:hypothetical protein